MRSQVQVAEMCFLHRVNPGRQGVPFLLLCIERRQLRWVGHLVRMSSSVRHVQLGRDLESSKRNNHPSWTVNSLGSPKKSWRKLSGKEMWATLLTLHSPAAHLIPSCSGSRGTDRWRKKYLAEKCFTCWSQHGKWECWCTISTIPAKTSLD